MHQGLFSGFVCFFHVHFSCTFIQIQSHYRLVAAQRWGMGFHLTGAYFWGRAYITSILENHTRAYFQVRSYSQGIKVVGLGRTALMVAFQCED